MSDHEFISAGRGLWLKAPTERSSVAHVLRRGYLASPIRVYFQGTGKVRRKVRIAAKLKGVRIHGLRHSFASMPVIGKLLGHGVSVAKHLVRKGLAMDWPRHSGGAYAAQQIAAKAERLGLWAGTFQPPWEWRAERRSREKPAVVLFKPAQRH